MSTEITDNTMSSDVTRHTATAVAGSRYGSWTVTWLPGVCLSYDQAITAMTIAEVATEHAEDLADAGNRWWLFIDGWAAELGLTAVDAVADASLSPGDLEDMPLVVTLAMDSRPGRIGRMISLDRATGTARVRFGAQTVTMPAAHLQYAGDLAAAVAR